MARRTLPAWLCLAALALSLGIGGGVNADVPATATSPAVPDPIVEAGTVIDEPLHGAISLQIGATEVVRQITGADMPNDTAARWDVHGTDLGHMFWHKGTLHMVFGDTFGPKGMFGRRNWRSNAMARIADPDPRNGLPITSMITGADGSAKELLSSRKIDGYEMTVIPTNGVSVGGRMYLHYMSVRHWGEPGHWNVNHSGLAYSDDDGWTWMAPAEAVQRQPIGFEQVAFVLRDDALYSFGIPEGRFGGVRLRRVAPRDMLVPGAHEYWDGAEWVADPAAAATIVAAPVGELSVAWSNAHGLWLMMYLDPKRRAIMLRSALRLTGPWSEPHLVVSADEHAGLYAPFIVPGSEIDTDLYYTLSKWEPYNVFLMRTTLNWGGIETVSAPTASPAVEKN